MAPGVDLTICATPPLPLPARAVEGHLMIEPVPSVQTLPAPFERNLEKWFVVPDESERTAMVIEVLGSVTPGLSALIAELFQLVILPSKICAMTDADRRRGVLGPDRLYEMVIGPITTGK